MFNMQIDYTILPMKASKGVKCGNEIALMEDAMQVIEAWGLRTEQNMIWVKTIVMWDTTPTNGMSYS